MPLQLDDLAALDAPSPANTGQPLHLPLVDIDEDPEQPRREFDTGALQELSETIRDRGVMQPISVRPHPQVSGRWVLNFGARRLRASKLAGLSTIPAFVDASADSYDQVIENEQREGLQPLDLALFIQRRLAAGDTQAEIARRMGKSRQYVTMAMALVDAPDWLLCAYREGRCRGLKELHDLRRLADEDPHRVAAWVADRDAISRDQVAALRNDLKALASVRHEAVAIERPTKTQRSPGVASPGVTRVSRARLVLQARLDGEIVSIDVGRAPSQPGCVFVQAGGCTQVVDAARLTLLGFDPA
jgi:ParB family transcriptional regulator, chromosome partitioning protein